MPTLVYGKSLDEIKTLSICDDGAEWPPYTYYKREKGKKTEQLVGFSVDVIAEILKKNNKKFDLKIIPWKRCQLSVIKGDTYQMLLSASTTQWRKDNFLFSLPYYESYQHYYYSKKTFPKGLEVKSFEHMKKFKVCGLRGYGYGDLGKEFKKKIFTDFTDYPALIKILHLRPTACQVFYEGIDIFYGFKAIGKDYLADKDLGHAHIPGSKNKEFYMLFPNNKMGKKLQELVNAGIKELKASGELNRMLKKYIQ